MYELMMWSKKLLTLTNRAETIRGAPFNLGKHNLLPKAQISRRLFIFILIGGMLVHVGLLIFTAPTDLASLPATFALFIFAAADKPTRFMCVLKGGRQQIRLHSL